MSNAKADVAALLKKLPDDCSVEDIQYHLYVLEKIRRGVQAADAQGSVTQAEAEARLRQWLIE